MCTHKALTDPNQLTFFLQPIITHGPQTMANRGQLMRFTVRVVGEQSTTILWVTTQFDQLYTMWRLN